MKKIRKIDKLKGDVIVYPGGVKAVVERTGAGLCGELFNREGLTITRKTERGEITSQQLADRMYAQYLRADLARRSAR